MDVGFLRARGVNFLSGAIKENCQQKTTAVSRFLRLPIRSTSMESNLISLPREQKRKCDEVSHVIKKKRFVQEWNLNSPQMVNTSNTARIFLND